MPEEEGKTMLMEIKSVWTNGQTEQQKRYKGVTTQTGEKFPRIQ